MVFCVQMKGVGGLVQCVWVSLLHENEKAIMTLYPIDSDARSVSIGASAESLPLKKQM